MSTCDVGGRLAPAPMLKIGQSDRLHAIGALSV